MLLPPSFKDCTGVNLMCPAICVSLSSRGACDEGSVPLRSKGPHDAMHRKETDCHASLRLARNHHAFSHRYKRKDYQCQVSFRARKGVGISRIALHFL